MGDGPQFIATAVRNRIDAAGAKTAFVGPGSPWTVFPTTGSCESFNAKLRDKLLNNEIF